MVRGLKTPFSRDLKPFKIYSSFIIDRQDLCIFSLKSVDQGQRDKTCRSRRSYHNSTLLYTSLKFKSLWWVYGRCQPTSAVSLLTRFKWMESIDVTVLCPSFSSGTILKTPLPEEGRKLNFYWIVLCRCLLVLFILRLEVENVITSVFKYLVVHLGQSTVRLLCIVADDEAEWSVCQFTVFLRTLQVSLFDHEINR